MKLRNTIEEPHWHHDSEWVLPPKQQRSRLTLKRILESAAALFIENGYDGTSMADIAHHSKMSIGAIYRRFPDKSAILYTIHENFYRHRAEQLDKLCNAVVWADKSAEEVVLFFVNVFFTAFRSDAGMLALLEGHRQTDVVISEGIEAWERHVDQTFAKQLQPHAEQLRHEDVGYAASIAHFMVRSALVTMLLLDKVTPSSRFKLRDEGLKSEVEAMILAYMLNHPAEE